MRGVSGETHLSPTAPLQLRTTTSAPARTMTQPVPPESSEIRPQAPLALSPLEKVRLELLAAGFTEEKPEPTERLQATFVGKPRRKAARLMSP